MRMKMTLKMKIRIKSLNFIIKVLDFIAKIKHILLENIIKEEDIEQDFQRNFSEHYSCSKNIIRKFI